MGGESLTSLRNVIRLKSKIQRRLIKREKPVIKIKSKFAILKIQFQLSPYASFYFKYKLKKHGCEADEREFRKELHEPERGIEA